MFGSVKCQISSGKIANYPQNTPFWPRFSTFWQRFLGGLKKMKKNFEEWVCRIWYENFFTPGTLLARFSHTAKPYNKKYAKLLYLQYLRIVNVERVKKRAQSGSGKAPAKFNRSADHRAKFDFLSQSTLKNKVLYNAK